MTWQEDVKAWVEAADARRRAEFDRDFNVYLVVVMAKDGTTRRYLTRTQDATQARDLGVDSVYPGEFFDVYVRRVDSSESLYKIMEADIALGRIRKLIPLAEEIVTNVTLEH